jgi:hypothetical protein
VTISNPNLRRPLRVPVRQTVTRETFWTIGPVGKADFYYLTAVEQFVVACPMCPTVFEAGRKTGGFEDEVDIVDLIELLVEAVDAGPTVVDEAGRAGAAAD